MFNAELSRGFTVLELLLAVSLGSVLMLALATVYLQVTRHYQVSNELGHLQGNVVVASHFLSQSIQNAGHLSCLTLDREERIHIQNHEPTAGTLEAVSGYEGSDGSWIPALPASLQGKVKSGTDVLQVSAAVPLGATVNRMTATAAWVSSEPEFTAGDWVVLSDCERADIVSLAQRMTLADGTQQLTVSGTWPHRYLGGAIVAEFRTLYFYLADTGRITPENQPVWGLFVKNPLGETFELLEGIDDLQFSFGVRTLTEADIQRYQDADDIRDWHEVQGVSWVLQLNSPYLTRAQRLMAGVENSTYWRQWPGYAALKNRSMRHTFSSHG